MIDSCSVRNKMSIQDFEMRPIKLLKYLIILAFLISAIIIVLFTSLTRTKASPYFAEPTKQPVLLFHQDNHETVTFPSRRTTSNDFPERCNLTTQESRHSVLKSWCEENHVTSNKYKLTEIQLRSLYVVDKYKLVYCRIPKTGCTNWKKYLILLSGKTDFTEISQIRGDDAHHDLFQETVRELESYSGTERNYIIENYFKFTVVRHPLTRLLSAYRNKFAKKNSVFEKFNQQALSYSDKIAVPGSRAQLNDFFKFLTDPAGTTTHLNEHWMNFHELCQPCRIQYDFIGQLETMSEDSAVILSRINAPYEFPTYIPSSDGKVKDMFEEIPEGLLMRVVSKYRDDFDSFGYNC